MQESGERPREPSGEPVTGNVAVAHYGLNHGLRWSPTLEWIAEPKGESHSIITFLRWGDPLLKLEVSNFLFKSVIDHIANRDKEPGKAKDLAAEDPRFSEFINLLVSRRILLPAQSKSVQIRVFSDLGSGFDLKRESESWKFQSDYELAIDLLAGDETFLLKHYKEFYETRPNRTLVSLVKISVDQVEIGPMRFVSESEVPKTRTSTPSCYPAWSERSKSVLPFIREVFEEAFLGSRWYALTINGFRKSWNWEEIRTPYKVEASVISQPKDCVPFFQYQARVEKEEYSGGSGETAVEAEFSAKCEAWERFCLARPDLIDSIRHFDAEDFKKVPGIHLDYLREMTRPLDKGPKWVEGRSISTNQIYKVPSEWIFFNEKSGVVNTNGAAFGATLEDAIQAAKKEAIERHLFMKAYLKMSPGRELKIDSNADLVSLAEKKNRRVRWYHLGESNKNHVVISVLTSDVPPYASIGIAARSSIADAARKSLYEAMITDFLWAIRIEEHGPQKFLQMGRETLKRTDHHIGLEESAWLWASMPDAASVLHSIFNSGQGGLSKESEQLDEDKFVYVDVGKNILTFGYVVKVLHPDALPLPSFYSHALSLFRMLGIPAPLPIPMN